MAVKYRFNTPRLVATLPFLIGFIGMILMSNDPVGGRPPSIFYQAVLGWIPACMFAFGGLRTFRIVVVISNDSVLVRNFFRTRRFNIDEVKSFEVTHYWGGPALQAALFDVNGRHYSTTAIGEVAIWSSPTPTVETVAAMNEQLEAIRRESQ